MVGSAACILAVLAMLGGHWLALQSFAWARMITLHAQQGSLASAFSKTFDGRHTCRLCLYIQNGRQQEQSENQKRPGVKPDSAPELLCEAPRAAAPLPPSPAAKAVPLVPVSHADYREPPSFLPPRAAAVSPRCSGADSSAFGPAAVWNQPTPSRASTRFTLAGPIFPFASALPCPVGAMLFAFLRHRAASDRRARLLGAGCPVRPLIVDASPTSGRTPNGAGSKTRIRRQHAEEENNNQATTKTSTANTSGDGEDRQESSRHVLNISKYEATF
jgi:hypothetical protein